MPIPIIVTYHQTRFQSLGNVYRKMKLSGDNQLAQYIPHTYLSAITSVTQFSVRLFSIYAWTIHSKPKHIGTCNKLKLRPINIKKHTKLWKKNRFFNKPRIFFHPIFYHIWTIEAYMHPIHKGGFLWLQNKLNLNLISLTFVRLWNRIW